MAIKSTFGIFSDDHKIASPIDCILFVTTKAIVEQCKQVILVLISTFLELFKNNISFDVSQIFSDL